MTTRFIDGPAAGVSLMLKRAPMMLRVVCDGRGQFDALDQLTDEPKASETVFVYVLASERSIIHISARPRSHSGWYQGGEYKFLAGQPAADTVRSNEAWRAWVDSNLDRLFTLHKSLKASHESQTRLGVGSPDDTARR